MFFRLVMLVLEIMEENPGAGEAAIGEPAVPPERTHQIFQNLFNVHGNVTKLGHTSPDMLWRHFHAHTRLQDA
jgi:hypothetical protein